MKRRTVAMTAALAMVTGLGVSSAVLAQQHPGGQRSQTGPGMMGPGQMGPGMMDRGMMMGAMMRNMMMRNMMRQMMGAGMMGRGIGPGLIYGMGPGAGKSLAGDDVRKRLGSILAVHGNKRLKIGKIVEKDNDTITAEIVTVDDSLVQKLEINRKSGFVRQASQ